jgi:polar amino acid transport system substrate-binding protein
MSAAALAELAPTGVLRAGINLSNFLLVSGKSPSGEPEGVAPDMARAIAQRLGVPAAYVTFPRPGELADAAGQGVWDVALIAAEPARAQTIAFSPAYAEIEATYLVPAGSPLGTIEEVDRPGVRIAIAPGAPTISGSAATSATPNWSVRRASMPRTTCSSPTGSTPLPACGRA